MAVQPIDAGVLQDNLTDIYGDGNRLVYLKDVLGLIDEQPTLTPQNDPLTIELKDKLCYVGVDLSTSRDMTAFARRFPPQPGLVTADWLLGQVLYDDIQAMPTLTPQNGWVSVEDAVPDPGERVLATDGIFVGEAYRSSANSWFRHTGFPWMDGVTGRTVRFWMPMPAPPTKGDQE